MIVKCTCMTKTPVVSYHDKQCNYRLFMETGIMKIDNPNNAEKQCMRETLKNNKCLIKFEKADGTIRTMEATTMSDVTNFEDEVAVSERLCHVYDIDNEGWRTFVWERLTDFSVMFK